MKIIQVVGRSNSGKTTFIRNLIPELKKIGTVAAIKHLGDHDYLLEDGKDTTNFFEAGADIAIGIDSHKSVVAIRNNSLDSMLDLLLKQGIEYVVIEGFKQNPFPKIVIGSLTIDNCILTNPEVEMVITSLDLFADYPKLTERKSG
jgi:molybdopterin-guanine dinucleotide biosynthesis protein MobB